MKRGELYIVSGGGDYTGKPRPAVIIQTHGSDADLSVTLCPFTTETKRERPFRLLVAPSDRNGIDTLSRIMVDKITTVRQRKIYRKIGELESEYIEKLNLTLAVFLGLT